MLSNDWNVVQLSDITDKITSGGTPKVGLDKYYKNGTIPFAKIHDITSAQGKLLTVTKEFITEEAIKETSTKVFPAGTLLISMYGSIGKVAVTATDIATNQAIAGFVGLNEEKVNIDFLKYRLIMDEKKWLNFKAGTTQANISATILKKHMILLPSLLEQQKIAAILSSVDEAIEKTEAIIEQTKKVKKGLMHQLLTKGIEHIEFKQTELGEIPIEWSVVSLNELISSLSAGVSVNSENRIKTLNEKGILKTSAVTNRKFNPLEHKTVLPKELERINISPKKGQIIISRMNTPLLVGSSSYIDKDYNDLFLPDRLWQTEVKENCNSLWLSYLLTWSVMRARISEIATGTSNSMKNISKKTFLTLKIALPPLSEQKRIGNMLSSVDDEITLEQQKLLKLNTLKKGLMQDLLTGKVRVQVVAPEVVSS